MSTNKNFLGMPVSGDIIEGSTRVEQKPIEELAPLFQALVDDPTIVEFGWTQYTPYFNDGDTCDFSVNALWVMTTEDVEWSESGDFDHYLLEVEYDHRSLGKVKKHWEGEWPDRELVIDGYEGPDEDRYNRCQDLDGALQSGAFETVLLDTFGDHAMVTVRKNGIEVEQYSHD
ncbi:hypothetical protein ACIQHZ_31405 [Streptomyces halstedii]|uniref:hypothetical protein n=1 Tax=Streptomyces halstedii TaxID=1944 RepID=UPI00382D44DD